MSESLEPPSGGRAPRRDGAALALLVVAAFALRFAVATQATLIEPDGAYWASLAGALGRGDWRHGWSTAWPPLYPALVALCDSALERAGAAAGPATLEWAGRLVSCIAGALLLVPLTALSRRLLPARAVLLPALIAAVHPRLVEYSAAALSESVFTLILMTALAVWVAARGRQVFDALAGGLFGVAFLARPEALPLAIGLWFAALLAGVRRDRGRLRLLFLAGVLVVSGPWLVHLKGELGEWSLGEKGGYNFWRTYRAAYAEHHAPPLALPARVNRSPELAPPPRPGELHLVEFVREHPGLVAANTARQLLVLLGSSLAVAAGWPVAVLGLLGLLAARGAPWRIVLATIGFSAGVVAPVSVDRRFMVPLVPLILLLAVSALDRWPDLARRGTVTLLAAGLFAYTLGIPSRAERAPEQRAAGEWLRARLGSQGAVRASAVMARKPWVAFYAGAPICDLPDAQPDSLLAAARAARVEFVVADARAARGDRPALRALLDPARAPAGWNAVLRVTRPDTLVLYRIAGEEAHR